MPLIHLRRRSAFDPPTPASKKDSAAPGRLIAKQFLAVRRIDEKRNLDSVATGVANFVAAFGM